jgi:hypothetical protein
MDIRKVREFQSAASEVLEDNQQMDEANTKAKLIRPFIENVLEWPFSTDVELEYSVKSGSGTNKVDYALIARESPDIFVEAKPESRRLKEKYKEQLSSYMITQNVNWGILTNGKEFQFLKREVNGEMVEVKSLKTVSHDNLDTQLKLLEALSKEAVESGSSKEIAERINKIEESVRSLRDNKEDLSEQVSGIIKEEIGNIAVQTVEQESKEFIDDLAESIEEQGHTILDEEQEVPEKTEDDESETNAVVGTISRSQIQGDKDEQVAIFPTRQSGLNFLKENNAWGFVRVGQNPDYVGMYVTGDAKEVQYFAKVKEIVLVDEANLERPAESYTEDAQYDEDKKVIVFEENSLYRLEDPITYRNKYPQGLMYTTLGSFKEAETTEDIFE